MLSSLPPVNCLELRKGKKMFNKCKLTTEQYDKLVADHIKQCKEYVDLANARAAVNEAYPVKPDPIHEAHEKITALAQENKRLREALGFYADLRNHAFSDPISNDGGRIARQALDVSSNLTQPESNVKNRAENEHVWLPIETAPKDGTSILAYHENHGYVGIVVFKDNEWELVDVANQPVGIGFYPTHWSPIPPSQALSGKGD